MFAPLARHTSSRSIRRGFGRQPIANSADPTIQAKESKQMGAVQGRKIEFVRRRAPGPKSSVSACQRPGCECGIVNSAEFWLRMGGRNLQAVIDTAGWYRFS